MIVVQPSNPGPPMLIADTSGVTYIDERIGVNLHRCRIWVGEALEHDIRYDPQDIGSDAQRS